MKFAACLVACVVLGCATARAQTDPPTATQATAAVPSPAPSPAEFAKGAELFASICSHCHGPKMVNPGTVSFDLRKFPRDDPARFFNSVQNGKRAMPPWKDVLHPDEIAAIWEYVRSGGVAPQ